MLSALETMLALETNQIILFVILGVSIVLLIVTTIIPQRKQKKKTEAMMNSLAAGDKIMTIGGFVGTIVDINSYTDRVTINVGSDDAPVNVVIIKNAIRNKVEGEAPAAPAPAVAPKAEEVKETKTEIEKVEEENKD